MNIAKILWLYNTEGQIWRSYWSSPVLKSKNAISAENTKQKWGKPRKLLCIMLQLVSTDIIRKSCALPWGFSLYSWQPHVTKNSTFIFKKASHRNKGGKSSGIIFHNRTPTMQQFKGALKSHIDELDSPIIVHVLHSFQSMNSPPPRTQSITKQRNYL